MHFIYFLFSLLKNIVPFEDDTKREQLQQEMTQKFDQLQYSGGILSTVYAVFSSVWARFAFVILFIPLQRKLNDFVFPQTAPPVVEDEYDEEDFEND